MPTENRPSNTEMVSFPRELSDDLAELIATRARVCGGGAFDIWEAICEGFGAPAPQPHAEPIAWMVGTAFWWTKEEAERDAAATGLPIVGLGPMTDAAEVERLKQELQVARAQGRAEVIEMIAQLDAETGLDEFIGSHQIGCTGEWGSHWKEDALRQHFDVDPAAAGEMERCRHSGYEIIILEEERDTLRGRVGERDVLLAEIAKRHWSGVDFDLPADLAARIKSLSASA